LWGQDGAKAVMVRCTPRRLTSTTAGWMRSLSTFEMPLLLTSTSSWPYIVFDTVMPSTSKSQGRRLPCVQQATSGTAICRALCGGTKLFMYIERMSMRRWQEVSRCRGPVGRCPTRCLHQSCDTTSSMTSHSSSAHPLPLLLNPSITPLARLLRGGRCIPAGRWRVPLRLFPVLVELPALRLVGV
jgi:hypothetical protein